MASYVIVILFLFLCSSSLAQEDVHIDVNIIDSALYIDSVIAHPDSIVHFFENKYGKPQRKRRGLFRKWRRYIYDDLGIEIMTRPNSISVDFSYGQVINSEPKNPFKGQITINGIEINSSYSFTEIDSLLSKYEFTNLTDESQG